MKVRKLLQTQMVTNIIGSPLCVRDAKAKPLGNFRQRNVHQQISGDLF